MDYFNLHTHQNTTQPDVLELTNQYPQEFDDSVPFYSIGIHPWHIIESRLDDDLKIIEEKLNSKSCIAIGECGLDKKTNIPFELQISAFVKQLALAEKYKKPVVLHCVASFQEIIAIKNKMKISVPMIIHGFSKNSQLANQLVKEGFYISFGKYLLINPELEKVFREIPNDRFFLETDTMEEGIKEIYKIASQYRKITNKELQSIIADNFQFVFNKSLRK